MFGSPGRPSGTRVPSRGGERLAPPAQQAETGETARLNLHDHAHPDRLPKLIKQGRSGLPSMCMHSRRVSYPLPVRSPILTRPHFLLSSLSTLSAQMRQSRRGRRPRPSGPSGRTAAGRTARATDRTDRASSRRSPPRAGFCRSR